MRFVTGEVQPRFSTSISCQIKGIFSLNHKEFLQKLECFLLTYEYKAFIYFKQNSLQACVSKFCSVTHRHTSVKSNNEYRIHFASISSEVKYLSSLLFPSSGNLANCPDDWRGDSLQEKRVVLEQN